MVCWSVFFPFFISFRFDLNSAWSFFVSARLILPSLILSETLKLLSNPLNFSSAVEPLYLYIKSSGLTSLSNLLFLQLFHLQVYEIFLFAFRSMDNLYCYEHIFWLFQFLFGFELLLFVFLLDLQSLLFVLQKLYEEENK